MFTLFIVSQHLYSFILYARNELNEYGNTDSLVSVLVYARRSKNYVQNMNRVGLEPFCCLQDENESYEVVPFSKYTLLQLDFKLPFSLRVLIGLV